MDSKELSLKNMDFYNDKINFSLKDVFFSLKMLLERYIECCYDISNINIEKHYLEKGINIIINVFKILLMYTRNLEIAKLYTSHSIYFFIEYINQITSKESEIHFVNLSLNDAILYVYRKSIFEISDSYKKKFTLDDKDNLKLKKINYLIILYKSLFLHIFFVFDKNNESEINENFKIMNIYFEKLFEKTLLNYDKDLSVLDRLYNRHSNIFNDNYEELNTIIKKIDDIIGKEL
tara:strand:+ start:423 stop:1124 length:702 start_codon:yes stop_codon:yes gene_type:complete